MKNSSIPKISEISALEFLAEQYGIEATLKPLPSYIDQNFRVQSKDGLRYVLKIANADESLSTLKFENTVLVQLASHLDFCPRVIANKYGGQIAKISDSDHQYLVRLISYIDGTPLASVKRHSSELMADLGGSLGQMDAALADLQTDLVREDFAWDLANATAVIKQYRPLVKDAALGKYIDQFTASYNKRSSQLIPNLRCSIIHNDANDNNIIIKVAAFDTAQEIAGIIDFGDLVHSQTINNLAIALSYAILQKPDPLATAAEIIKAYQQEFPLLENELTVLFDLICLRLSVSVCMAAKQQDERPEEEYLSISQQPIADTMPKLAEINPAFAEMVFRQAVGLSPVRNYGEILNYLAATDFASIIPPAKMEALDFTVSSPLFTGDPESFELPSFSGENIVVAGYGEANILHLKKELRAKQPAGEHKCYHLGVDLFPAPGTPVFAPLDSEVVEVGEGFVLLKHGQDASFYTIYRGISPATDIGQTVAKGEQFALVKTHIHFQIITDLFATADDIPGTCWPAEKDVWQAISPNPALILQLPEASEKAGKQELLDKRNQRIGKSLSVGYDDHIVMERGWKQYLFDQNGRRYIDAYNNVPHVGHCHPEVVEAATRQMQLLNTNTRYLQHGLQEYAEALLATMPKEMEVCYFLNTGSEANELALRLARRFTGQKDLIVLTGAYHGITTTMTEISPYKHDGPGGDGAPDWVHTAPQADLYRGPYQASDPDAATKYADHVQELIAGIEKQGRGLSAFIAESCPSVGGQIFFPVGYLSQVYQHVRAAGGLNIADEVQTGYGRTGKSFYAFQVQGVTPDIVVLGKPIGNGHPISAVVTTRQVADAFNNGMELFSTFGGNSVSCAVGRKVLEVVQQENLQEHALKVGDHLKSGLEKLKEEFQIIGDVRGSGLFLGVELVRDRQTLEPAAAEASFVANRMRGEGILLGTDGPLHNVVKIRPPMPFSIQDADQLLAKMAQIMGDSFV